ncbi:hypothetical protein AB1K84_22925 [Mesobacillus foraminis]|uniref:hypothetical protein n=1 Tax=Mesobacillus foraminis TaxID=279826 RepID=UPI000EF4962D|nr:hypothetical protein [Mesobacillus foraminis]
MIKTVLVGFIAFIAVSSMFLLIGNVFDIKLFLFSFYEETPTGFEAGGSIIPFIIGLIASYFIGNSFQNRQRNG